MIDYSRTRECNFYWYDMIDYSKTRECNLYCEDMIDYSIIENAISICKIWLITVVLENAISIGKIWLITVGLSILSPRFKKFGKIWLGPKLSLGLIYDLSFRIQAASYFPQSSVLKRTELKTFEWWISGLMLNPLLLLISRLNIACSPLIFNLQIKYPIGIN